VRSVKLKTSGVVDLPSTTVPKKVFTQSTPCIWFQVYPLAANSGASIVFGSSQDISASGVNAGIPLAKGSIFKFEAMPGASFSRGEYFDLSQFWFLPATAGDDVIVEYLSVES